MLHASLVLQTLGHNQLQDKYITEQTFSLLHRNPTSSLENIITRHFLLCGTFLSLWATANKGLEAERQVAVLNCHMGPPPPNGLDANKRPCFPLT